MKPIIIINKFNSVRFKKDTKPLVICDIDDTVICPVLNYDYYYHKLKDRYTDISELNRSIHQMLDMDISHGFMMQTDKKGFAFMRYIIHQLGGKLVFLTARGQCYHNKTIQDLKSAGLDQAEQFEIYYTNNNISKAEFIHTHLSDQMANHEHIIFIDDQKQNIEKIISSHPNIHCYLFQMGENEK